MKNRKRRNSSKRFILLVAVAILLTAVVSGTVAYLVTSTTPIVNTFTPAEVSTDVTDEMEGNTKKNVQIKNTSNIPVYMRVAVTANWYKDGKIVAGWNDYKDLNVDSSKWTFEDGYYYYKGRVEVDETVTLFASYVAPQAPIEGAHLEMDISAQVIQADGMDASSAKDAFDKAKGAQSSEGGQA